MKHIIKISMVILVFPLLQACGLSERYLEYRDSSISGIVDSTIYFKPFDGKKHFFLVDGKWYVVPVKYYAYFYDYLDKGDSVFKKAGRWDIFIYKKKNNKYIEKYFVGAQNKLE